MSIGSNPIQFPSTLSAQIVVDTMTDPNGAPANVLDVDLGFSISGHIDFPNWLSGTGNVSVYADELGGSYDAKILTKDIPITAGGPEGGVTTYNWTVTYPTDRPSGGTPLPDPSPGSQVYRLAVVFTFNGQPTDIAGFVELGTFLIN
jgi:hypothetical protein